MANVTLCICYLNIITFKLSKDVSAVFKLIDQLMDRYPETIIEELTQSLSSILLDVSMSIDEDDEEEHGNFEITDVVEAQIELMKMLLTKVSDLKKLL